MIGSVALLTEDSASDARQTQERLVHHILLLAYGNDWQRRRQIEALRYDPPNNPQVQQVLHGQRWRSASPRHRKDKLELARYLADRLVSARSVVVFHLDGDCPWSRRPSTVLTDFEEFLVTDRII